MNEIFRILKTSSPRDGLRVRREKKLVTWQLLFPSLMVLAAASGNRISPLTFLVNLSLALMELRYVIAMFLWHFDVDFAFPAQDEPYYKDAFVVLRGPLPIKLKSRFAH